MENSNLTVSVSQGPKNYQEDYHVILPIKETDLSGWLLAVMDGHIGSTVSEFCANEIKGLFKILPKENPEFTLSRLVSRLNSRTIKFKEGSTLSIALVLENLNQVSVAVLGDSPILILDKSGKLHISPEHNVRSNAKERYAAILRGGEYNAGYIRGPKNHDAYLQLSRALGDSEFEGIISRKPELYTIKDPQWILVASDGLLDPTHLESEILYEQVKEYAQKGLDANELMSWAEERRLEDNATAVVWCK